MTPEGVKFFDSIQVGGISAACMYTPSPPLQFPPSTSFLTFFLHLGFGRIPRASFLFTEASVKNFNPNSCQGITVDGMTGLPGESYKGFQGTCITNILASAFAGMFICLVPILNTRACVLFRIPPKPCSPPTNKLP